MQLAAFRALVRKDLVLYFSNRRALVMSILAPIVIAAFFGAIFGSGMNKPTRIPIAPKNAAMTIGARIDMTSARRFEK